jgi:hypothetical protein
MHFDAFTMAPNIMKRRCRESYNLQFTIIDLLFILLPHFCCLHLVELTYCRRRYACAKVGRRFRRFVVLRRRFVTLCRALLSCFVGLWKHKGSQQPKVRTSSDLGSKVGLMGQEDNWPRMETIHAVGKMTQQSFHAMVKRTMCRVNRFKLSKHGLSPGTRCGFTTLL